MMEGCAEPPERGCPARTGKSTRSGESASHPKSKLAARVPKPCLSRIVRKISNLIPVYAWFQSKR